MTWRKWWPRLTEIPAIFLAIISITFQILHNLKIWSAPIEPLSEVIVLLALLVLSFFAVRQRIEGLEQLLGDRQTGELVLPVVGRADVDMASAKLLNDTPVPSNEREILLVTVMTRRNIEANQISKPAKSGQLMDRALADKIIAGWAVKRVIIVRYKADLDFVVAQYIIRFDKANQSNYEVRVLAKPETLPPVPLLVVGRQGLLLGLYGEGVGTGMRGALVVHGAKSIGLAQQHFQTLWDRPDCVRLRPHQTGKLDQAAYDRISRELEASSLSD